MGPQVTFLPDGQRLHLQHGPIDLIIGATGDGRVAAFARASDRFATVLDELVVELKFLRQPVGGNSFSGEIARRMQGAVLPFRNVFVTPMAAVAGAVADTVLGAMTGTDLRTAYVNNGGDVAIWLADGEQMTAAVAAGLPDQLTVHSGQDVGGIATSGWRGRSFSFGIADGVTVLATSAAQADAAATLIANAVDLPGNAKISRQPACDLAPDSDLGQRLVTVDVGLLTHDERDVALDRGGEYADMCLRRGLIRAALITLDKDRRVVGASDLISLTAKDLKYA